MTEVYKTFNRSDIENRNITAVDTTTKQNMQNIINNFVTYFKSKHLS
jgi:hypothetical protein